MSHIDRRKFMQLMGMTGITSTLKTNIAKALDIPANNRTPWRRGSRTPRSTVISGSFR
jgi:hypothetical protein